MHPVLITRAKSCCHMYCCDVKNTLWCIRHVAYLDVAGVHATFLWQCVSAIDSISLLADALKAAKPGLLQLLKGAGLSKEVEAYYSRTVDAAADLRDAIYLGAAKRLLPVRQQPLSTYHHKLLCRTWADKQKCVSMLQAGGPCIFMDPVCAHWLSHVVVEQSSQSCTAVQGGGRGFVLTQCWIFHAVCFVLAPQGVSDDEYGLAAAIAECSYNMTEPATRYQPWVATVLQQYSAFGNFAASSGLPANVQQKVCFERRCRFSTASGQVHGLCSGRGHCKHSLLRLSIAPSLF